MSTLYIKFAKTFKSGVGFSLRKCRTCLATYEQMSTKVTVFQDNVSSTLAVLLYLLVSSRRLYSSNCRVL